MESMIPCRGHAVGQVRPLLSIQKVGDYELSVSERLWSSCDIPLRAERLLVGVLRPLT